MEKLQELKKLVNYCRKNGVTSLKCDGFEFEIHPAAVQVAKGKDEGMDISKMPPPEDLLMWSADPVPNFEPQEEVNA
jgi:hypothetical protein